MNSYRCRKCRIIKQECEYTSSQIKLKNKLCKECVSEKNKEYNKGNSSKVKSNVANYKKTIKGIWVAFRSHKKNSKYGFDIKEDEFIKWYIKQGSKCHYCGLNEIQSNKIYQKYSRKKDKHWKLQFDRKDSEGKYSVDNLVLSCKICNEHKSDFFSYEDFVKISQNYLGTNLLD